MPDPASQRAQLPVQAAADDGADDYPVREYIGSMAKQLAMMARSDGDEGLAALLDAAVERAARPASGIRLD